MVGIYNFPKLVLTAMAELVRVKEKFQVTIPVALRRLLELREGDYLEARLTTEGIVLSPQRLVGAASQRATTILDFLKEERPDGRTREEINTALSADRDSWRP